MKLHISLAAMTLVVGAAAAGAQDTTKPRDTTTKTTKITQTSAGDVIIWQGPLGYTLRPNLAPVYCGAGDSTEVAKVQIKTENYDAMTMISPEQAKALALCAVPGQISGGEFNVKDGKAVYDITLLPTDKKTYTKIQIDAATGEVLNAKQFGGLRGLAGFLRESSDRKANKVKEP
jgi:hypothetical protein